MEISHLFIILKNLMNFLNLKFHAVPHLKEIFILYDLLVFINKRGIVYFLSDKKQKWYNKRLGWTESRESFFDGAIQTR